MSFRELDILANQLAIMKALRTICAQKTIGEIEKRIIKTERIIIELEYPPRRFTIEDVREEVTDSLPEGSGSPG